MNRHRFVTAPGIRRRDLGWGLCAALALPASRLQAAGAGDADGARLAAVIAGAHRSANRARDGARRPFETLRFFGLQPTHTVIELGPGGGWYTEILAPYLRERGLLLAAHEARDADTEYRRNSRARYEQKLAEQPALYDRVRMGERPLAQPPRGFGSLAAPASVDRVLSFRNVHNWIESGDLQATLRASLLVLKPGGVLGLVEHRALPGASLAQAVKTGYIPADWLIEQARAAGFTAVERSEANANPRDTKDHPHGVWSLPPTLRGGDADRARFLAIGESDRMTLKFTKSRG
jgi:predicted methyltransferase